MGQALGADSANEPFGLAEKFPRLVVLPALAGGAGQIKHSVKTVVRISQRGRFNAPAQIGNGP